MRDDSATSLSLQHYSYPVPLQTGQNKFSGPVTLHPGTDSRTLVTPSVQNFGPRYEILFCPESVQVYDYNDKYATEKSSYSSARPQTSTWHGSVEGQGEHSALDLK